MINNCSCDSSVGFPSPWRVFLVFWSNNRFVMNSLHKCTTLFTVYLCCKLRHWCMSGSELVPMLYKTYTKYPKEKLERGGEDNVVLLLTLQTTDPIMT